MRSRVAALLTLWTGVALAACGDEFPTSPDPGRMPVDPVTVEVRLPFSAFATDATVLEGFGTAADLGTAVVARDFHGSLDARTLTRFRPYPTSAQVRNPEGETVTDTVLTFVGGRIVARVSSDRVPEDRTLTLRAGLTTVEWDHRTATWELAVDTLDDRRAWPVPGGGPVDDLGTAVLEPAEEDDDEEDDDEEDDDEEEGTHEVVFELDSAQVARLGDREDPSRGVRLSMETTDVRLTFDEVELQLTTRPSVDPDTLITLTRSSENLTFVFDPPPPSTAGLRVGGVPAARTILTLDLPEELDGPPNLCARVGCPIRLEPEQVNAAFLLLRTREVPEAFQPADSLLLDLRPVLAPELLPKSPLGASVAPQQGVRVDPAAFTTEGAGRVVAIPLSDYVRDLLRAEDEGPTVSRTLSILAFPEPSAFGFASFAGPDEAGEPVLRLILTFAGEVEHP